MGIFRSDLEGTNTGKFLIIMTYLASKVYCRLSFCHFVLISGHFSELSLPGFPLLGVGKAAWEVIMDNGTESSSVSIKLYNFQIL